MIDDVMTAPRLQRWPYRLGFGLLVFSAAAFVYAPFSGIVYIAIPALALPLYFSFAERSPFRAGMAVALGTFVVGIVLGAIGLGLVLPSETFAAEEASFAAVALGLWGFPLMGLLIGLVSVGLAAVHAKRLAAPSGDGERAG